MIKMAYTPRKWKGKTRSERREPRYSDKQRAAYWKKKYLDLIREMKSW